MSNQAAIKLFETRKIRTAWKTKLKAEGSELSHNLGQLKLILEDGNQTVTNCNQLKQEVSETATNCSQLKQEGVESTTICSTLKLPAIDGKMWLTNKIARKIQLKLKAKRNEVSQNVGHLKLHILLNAKNVLGIEN